jgi:hypothetical protein
MRFHATLQEDFDIHRMLLRIIYPLNQTPMPNASDTCISMLLCVRSVDGTKASFALGVVELLLVELGWPNRLFSVSAHLPHTPSNNSTDLALLLTNICLKVLAIRPLTRPIMPALVIRRTAYKTTMLALINSSQQLDMCCREDTLVPRLLPPAGVCVGEPPPAEKRSSIFWTPCVL